ncbi:flagellar basal body rod protein FlgB [Hydrogenimonas sp. SS33]|uniref:flagellar basal body rod protein FlgB n=1 Tax=Hydrogenimonas leucolamina TaxID=2954236 RepID=UPI00336C2EF6
MQISRVHNLMAEALDYRGMRQDMISANIANVDTPFYRSRDIGFEGVLAKEADKIFPKPSPKLALAQTEKGHLPGFGDDAPSRAEIFFRDGHTARNDGNTVDLDVETTEMAKNTVMYNAIVAALKKDSALFRSVLDASAKV